MLLRYKRFNTDNSHSGHAELYIVDLLFSYKRFNTDNSHSVYDELYIVCQDKRFNTDNSHSGYDELYIGNVHDTYRRAVTKLQWRGVGSIIE